MRIERRFTTAGQDPLSGLAMRRLPEGGALVPFDWSEAEANAFAAHGLAPVPVPARQSRMPEAGLPMALWPAAGDAPRDAAERDARAAIGRLAGALAHGGWQQGRFARPADAMAFRDEIAATLLRRMAVPDRAFWQGVGLGWAYGIDGDAGRMAEPAAVAATEELLGAARGAALIRAAGPVAPRQVAPLDAVAGAQRQGAAADLARAIGAARVAGLSDQWIGRAVRHGRQDRPGRPPWRDLPAPGARTALRLAVTSEPGPALAAALCDGVRLDLQLAERRGPAPRAALRLTAFDADGGFDRAGFVHAAGLWALALDIAAGPGGLGLLDLGAWLAGQGLAYATPAARAAAAEAGDLLQQGCAQAGGRTVAAIGRIDAAAIAGCPAEPLAPLAALVTETEMAGEAHQRAPHPAVMRGLEALGLDAAARMAAIRHLAGHGTLDAAPGLDHAALRRRGFGTEQIARVEAALAESGGLRQALTPWRLGRGFCAQALGLELADYADPRRDFLADLGISPAVLARAERHVFGHGTLRGAPGLSEAQAMVFDHAAPGGARADQVDVAAQIDMAAALQAAVAGEVVSRIALPDAAGPAEAAAAIERARAAGLGRVVLHRDADAAALATLSELERALPRRAEPAMAPPQRLLDDAAPAPGRATRARPRRAARKRPDRHA
ncbi:hypothetical protein [Limimaricola pyoseonensis]|uniref:Class II vitamin B12-dependent ribonucleotide reductase n=1 Tax=Limimaricola pyoseonensis TaxID=521013 RepID=A0A1G7GVR4_9RHOB|nr:hypothetical protein [Limimaricola pyoseonensis]SDE92237.1 Class II vitamin B12-dependent ribonucleotide reductase [Limimaricola pyoseonensis]